MRGFSRPTSLWGVLFFYGVMMEKICRRCNKKVNALVEEMPSTSIHYGKTLCPICNSFIDWVKKPENDDQRGKSSKYKIEQIGINHCELCGREKEKLGMRETLEIHHKTPIEEDGEDTKENILILCTPCHRISHFMRTYLHRHLDNFYSFYIDKKNDIS